MNKKEITQIKQQIRNKLADKYKEKGIWFSKTFQEHKKKWDWDHDNDECLQCGKIGLTMSDEPTCYTCYLKDWKKTWQYNVDKFDNVYDASEVALSFEGELEQEWWKSIKEEMFNTIDAYIKSQRDIHTLIYDYNEALKSFKKFDKLYSLRNKKVLNISEKEDIIDEADIMFIDMEIHIEHWVAIENSRKFFSTLITEISEEVANCRKIYSKAMKDMVKMQVFNTRNILAREYIKENWRHSNVKKN